MAEKKHNHAERRIEVKRIIEQLGTKGLPVTNIAKKYDCHPKTIYKDIDWIIKHTKPDDIEHVKWSVQNSYNKMEMEIYRLLNNPTITIQEKIQAIRAFTNIQKDKTELLEKYGLKERIAEKHDIQVSEKIDIEELKKIIEPEQ